MTEVHQDERDLVERAVTGERNAIDFLDRRTREVVARCLDVLTPYFPEPPLDEREARRSFNLWLLEDHAQLLRNFSGRASLDIWLHILAMRHLHRELDRRASALRRGTELSLSEREPLPSVTEELDLRKAKLHRARSVVTDLALRDRLLLKLLLDQDAPVHVVAAALGTAEIGVRWRRNRLLTGLARAIGGTLGGGSGGDTTGSPPGRGREPREVAEWLSHQRDSVLRDRPPRGEAHIPDEVLAAVLQRARPLGTPYLAHLARCSECRAVLAHTGRALPQLAGRRVRLWRSRPFRRVALLALAGAALLAGVLAAVHYGM
jgi:hypothetical protein